MAKNVEKMINDDGGEHDIKAKESMDKITLTDEMGGTAHVTITDAKQSTAPSISSARFFCRRWNSVLFHNQTGRRPTGCRPFISRRPPGYIAGSTVMSRTSLSSPVIGPTSVAAPVSRLTV